MEKPFTGRHMTAILVGSFAVILGVNLTMARLASSTFGGEVVENSYVASQEFNRWLTEADASRQLGWSVEPHRVAGGRVSLLVNGAPPTAIVSAIARHPLGYEADRTLTFSRGSDGAYASREPLPAGRWTLRIAIDAGHSQWRGEAQIL